MKEEQLIIAKILDKIKKYEKTGSFCSTNFLDPLEILETEHLVKKFPSCYFGGYNNAERKILFLGSDDENIAKEYIEILTIECNKNMSHREVLGSVLGLGLSRDVIGDIIIKENRADIFVTKEISQYIVQNLNKVGKERVNVYKNSYDNLLVPDNNSKEIKTTVASLRIDAVISVAIGTSREISAKLIENQKVKLNYKLISNSSKQIKIGDKISVRGYGRIELIEILGETKKGRIRIVLRKF